MIIIIIITIIIIIIIKEKKRNKLKINTKNHGNLTSNRVLY